MQSDLALAALAARAAGRPVKLVLAAAADVQQHHPPAQDDPARPAGRRPDGRLTAIGHDSWSGNLAGGRTEPTHHSDPAALSLARTGCLRRYLATLDLAEGNAMRAPGEAPGMMALEIAMDELAEKLGMDPVDLRIANDTAGRSREARPPFFHPRRSSIACGRRGPVRLGASGPATPASRRDGRLADRLWVWRARSGAHRSPRRAPASGSNDPAGSTVETDMTDHRHRQLHDRRADRGRDDGRSTGPGRGATRRLRLSRNAGIRRPDGRSLRRPQASMRHA